MKTQYRGYHVMLDYVTDPFPETPAECAEWITSHLGRYITDHHIRIVHQHTCIFDGSVSPPGFAIGFLLDESHLTAHSYSDRGMLAIDIFTCGLDAGIKTTGIAADIDRLIKDKLKVQKWEMHIQERFPYREK